ncbi:MAG: DegV family protein [Coriobacteriia bacterium]|nr:DegV family protein [Coriobacteriia bacterium]
MTVCSYDIITDSSANLPDSMIDAWGLKVLSLEFIVDGVSYKGYDPDVKTDNHQFYTMMRDGKEVQTAMASIIDAEVLLRDSFDRGQDVLYLGFDSALSATYEVISEHMEKIRAEFYADRQLRCVDTFGATLGEGLLVAEAVQRRDAGYSLDQLADWAIANRFNVACWFTVDDLKYLQRGGRLSAGAAFAGMLLSIKPVLQIDGQGLLIPMEKLRGRRRSIQFLADKLADTIRQPTAGAPVFISHADCLEDCQALERLILERFPDVEILVNELDPVIGAHSGPGTLAVFFWTDQER